MKKSINKTKSFKLSLELVSYKELVKLLNDVEQFIENIDSYYVVDVDTENVYGYYDSCDTKLLLTVRYTEEETDEAYNARIEKEHKAKEEKLQADRLKREKRGNAKQLLKLGETDPVVKKLLEDSGIENYIRNKYNISANTIL